MIGLAETYWVDVGGTDELCWMSTQKWFSPLQSHTSLHIAVLCSCAGCVSFTVKFMRDGISAALPRTHGLPPGPLCSSHSLFHSGIVWPREHTTLQPSLLCFASQDNELRPRPVAPISPILYFPRGDALRRSTSVRGLLFFILFFLSS